ncbi:MAG: hypothetical protein AAFV07_08655, partial [Bacteroidota bacterium]
MLLLAACQPAEPIKLTTGSWRATLDLAETAILPFQATLEQSAAGELSFTIHNAEERIVVDDIRRRGDSLYMEMPVFNSRIEARIVSTGELEGRWRDFSRGDDYSLPFAAKQVESPRFKASKAAATP